MQKDSNLPKADLQAQINLLQNRQLLGSALLFIYSHQPLTFVGGQFLHFVSPILNIVAPDRNWHDWAESLSNKPKTNNIETGKLETDKFEPEPAEQKMRDAS